MRSGAKVFAKLSKRIIMSAREGGGDPALNASLRTIVDEAKAAEMPKDKIEYAIKRGTGEVEGVNYEVAQYEGYGPGGVAMIISCLTDNEKRSVSDVRSIMKKHGGSLGSPGKRDLPLPRRRARSPSPRTRRMRRRSSTWPSRPGP